PGLLYLWLQQRKKSRASLSAMQSLSNGSAMTESESAATSLTTLPGTDSARPSATPAPAVPESPSGSPTCVPKQHGGFATGSTPNATSTTGSPSAAGSSSST